MTSSARQGKSHETTPAPTCLRPSAPRRPSPQRHRACWWACRRGGSGRRCRTSVADLGAAGSGTLAVGSGSSTGLVGLPPRALPSPPCHWCARRRCSPRRRAGPRWSSNPLRSTAVGVDGLDVDGPEVDGVAVGPDVGSVAGVDVPEGSVELCACVPAGRFRRRRTTRAMTANQQGSLPTPASGRSAGRRRRQARRPEIRPAPRTQQHSSDLHTPTPVPPPRIEKSRPVDNSDRRRRVVASSNACSISSVRGAPGPTNHHRRRPAATNHRFDRPRSSSVKEH